MVSPASIKNLESGSTRVGILLNPKGGQARKYDTVIRLVLADFPTAILREARNAAEFKPAVDDLMQADIDLLVIIAGDGTIKAVLGLLFSSCPDERWPVLLTVPGGTTNMTSLDLGIKGRPEQVLLRLKNHLLQQAAPLFTKRVVLCVEQTGMNKVYGMFFGIGLITRGVKFSRGRVKRMGVTGGFFTLLIILRSLAGLILGKKQSRWASVDLSIDQSGNGMQRDCYMLGLVSALDHLLLGMRPYWGQESAPLHVTMVKQQRKHLWRSLWPILSGRGHHLKQQDGYYSYNTQALELMINDEFIVDGELYQSSMENGPLRITATDPVTFLVI